MNLSSLLYNNRYKTLLLACVLSIAGQRAQAASAADSLQWTSLGVYDTWEHSPFMTGRLKGNVVVEQEAIAFQRSRYGSNTYGLRIDLKQPFELTPELKYVHVRILKPKAGRTMLIGLGKRRDRAGQSPLTEQFWVYSTQTVEPGQWTDAVFPVKGAGGIDIHSLVVVPDCESTHNLKSDFMAHVGTMEVNDNPTSGTLSTSYPLSFSPEGATVPAAEGISTVGTGKSTVKLPEASNGQQPRYTALLEEALDAAPGEHLAFTINGQPAGEGSVSIDLDRDGRFSAKEQFNGTVDLPSSLPYGYYRVRFHHGLAVADTRLNVHPQTVTVNQEGRNGEVVLSDGQALSALRVAFGTALAVKAIPSHGFTCSGVRVRCGYNLTGDQLLHGTPQYVDHVIPRSAFKANGVVLIPAELVRGDIVIEGLFVSK